MAFDGETLDARVVMEPYPKDMPNLEMFGGLHFSPLGQDIILDFDDPMPMRDFVPWAPRPQKETFRLEREFRESVEARQQRRFREDVTNPRQWPANGVVLLADVDEEGYWIKTIPADDLPRGDVYFSNVRFVMTDGPKLAEGGGFIRYVPKVYRRQKWKGDKWQRGDPPKDLTHLPAFIDAGDVETADRVVRDQQRVDKPVHGIAYDETYREMGVAPEEGYEPELRFSPVESIVRMKLGGYGWRMYFYFKTADGRYGKGYFEEGGVGGEENKPALTMRCVLYVNPIPGDRRLDDGRAGRLERDPDRPVNLNLPATRPATD